MKPNIRAILEDCIERGVEDGLRRVEKHTENPSNGLSLACVMEGIWLHLDQYFFFEEDI